MAEDVKCRGILCTGEEYADTDDASAPIALYSGKNVLENMRSSVPQKCCEE